MHTLSGMLLALLVLSSGPLLAVSFLSATSND